jgi:hypothetical protein
MRLIHAQVRHGKLTDPTDRRDLDTEIVAADKTGAPAGHAVVLVFPVPTPPAIVARIVNAISVEAIECGLAVEEALPAV